MVGRLPRVEAIVGYTGLTIHEPGALAPEAGHTAVDPPRRGHRRLPLSEAAEFRPPTPQGESAIEPTLWVAETDKLFTRPGVRMDDEAAIRLANIKRDVEAR